MFFFRTKLQALASLVSITGASQATTGYHSVYLSKNTAGWSPNPARDDYEGRGRRIPECPTHGQITSAMMKKVKTVGSECSSFYTDSQGQKWACPARQMDPGHTFYEDYGLDWTNNNGIAEGHNHINHPDTDWVPLYICPRSVQTPRGREQCNLPCLSLPKTRGATDRSWKMKLRAPSKLDGRRKISFIPSRPLRGKRIWYPEESTLLGCYKAFYYNTNDPTLEIKPFQCQDQRYCKRQFLTRFDSQGQLAKCCGEYRVSARNASNKPVLSPPSMVWPFESLSPGYPPKTSTWVEPDDFYEQITETYKIPF